MLNPGILLSSTIALLMLGSTLGNDISSPNNPCLSSYSCQYTALENGFNSSEDTTMIKEPLLGIYYGNQGWRMDQVQALEAWQGKKYAVLNLFTNWANDPKVIDNLFQQQLPNIWNNQNIPMISWEPYTIGTTPNDIEVQIANGEHDSYIHHWADQLKAFLSGPDGQYGTADDRRVYLRLAHEMNGDWYPWGATMGNNSPNDYIRMWRHTKAIFDSKGLDSSRLQWVWSVNHRDIGRYKAEEFYPGDSYVDWVSIDGYNWGASQSWSSWQTPAEVFDNMINRLHKITDKPIAITEVGTTSLVSPKQNDLARKSAWITDFRNYVVNRDIKMVIWFNEDKETDWAVFGGIRGDGNFKRDRTTYKAYSTYKADVIKVSADEHQ